MIEHDVKLVMGICDRLMLDYGKTAHGAGGAPESVLSAVVDVHYGGIQAVRDVSFTLREGRLR
jgi:ABC-type branched-subunit amino acid transport system ATPase component